MRKILLFILLIFLMNATIVNANPSSSGKTSGGDSFVIDITIPDDYETIYPGEELLASIKILNLGSSNREDVFLDYWISGSSQNVVLKKRETVAVETQANFVRMFDIPGDVSPGNYEVYVKVTSFDGTEVEVNHSFKVGVKEIDNRIYYVFVTAIALAFLIYGLIKAKPKFEEVWMKVRVWEMVHKRHLKKK